jgi:hypothetical protein
MPRFLRPKASVLPESALIPAANLVQPAPTRFTHALRAAQPYHYSEPAPGQAPDGEFEAGTKLALQGHVVGPWCHVVDGRGLSVVTALAGLVPLP